MISTWKKRVTGNFYSRTVPVTLSYNMSKGSELVLTEARILQHTEITDYLGSADTVFKINKDEF